MLRPIIGFFSLIFVLTFAWFAGIFLIVPIMWFTWTAPLWFKLGVLIVGSSITMAAFSERLIYGVVSYIICNVAVYCLVMFTS